MRLPAAAALLLPTFTYAHMAWRPQIPSAPESVPTLTQDHLPQETSSISSIPNTLIPTATHIWDPLITGASHLLDEIDDHLHVDLRKRQGGVAATNVVPATTAVTQMPPVTVYDMNDGKAYTYTQLFALPIVTWPSPSAGTVGLGTITGQIGVVKTNSKRGIDELAEPTPAPSSSSVYRIRGREVTMS